MKKPSKKLLIIALLILLGLGVGLTVYQLQKQQQLKQFASQSTQSASAVCSSDGNTSTIQVSFTNTENDKDLIVTAKDLQTGKTVDLGTIAHGETKTASIETDKSSLDAGGVVFTITAPDASVDTQTANYQELAACPKPTPIPACIENQAFCRWETLDGAVNYTVVIKETDTGKIIKSETVPQTASESAFIMEPDKTYECSVTPQNSCGVGPDARATQKSCVLPSPTPTNTPTPTDTPTPTREITMTPTNTPTPEITNPPTPTDTPAPTSPTSPPNPTATPTTFFSASQTPPPNLTQTFIAGDHTTIPVTGDIQTSTLLMIVSIVLSVGGLLLFFAL